MLSKSAAALLDGVRVLHQERPRWLELVSLDVTVTSAVDGAVVTRWLVDEAEIRRLTMDAGMLHLPGHNGSVILPVFSSAHPQVPVTEQVSMIGLGAMRPLPGLHGDSLRRIAEKSGLTVSPAYDRVLTVSFPTDDLDDLTELSISVPYTAGTGPGGLLRFLWAMNPVEVIDVTSLWSLRPDKGVGLEVPEEVQTDTAVVTIPSAFDPKARDRLERLRSALQASPRPELRGAVATRQLIWTAPVLQQAADRMRDEVDRLDEIAGDGVDATHAKRRVAKSTRELLDIVAELETRAAWADRWDRFARIRVTTLVEKIDQALAIYNRIERHRLLANVRRVPPPARTSPSSMVVTCPAAPVEALTLVYSTRRKMLRLRRLGTTRSLLVLGAVLLFVAWRLQIAWPLTDQDPAAPDVVHTEALKESRDSLVALLVVFPALLYTQLERIGSDRRIFDSTVDVSVFCASLAFLLPVAVAVLTVGDLRPDLVVKSCAWAGAGAVGTALLVALLLSDGVLRRLRSLTCRWLVRR